MSRFNIIELERYETSEGRLHIVVAFDHRRYYSDEEEHEDSHRDLFAFLNEQEILNEVQAMFIINYFNNKCVKLIFSLSLYKLKFWLNLYFNLN